MVVPPPSRAAAECDAGSRSVKMRQDGAASDGQGRRRTMPTRIYIAGVPEVVVEAELNEVTAELGPMGVPFATFKLSGEERKVLIRRDAVVRLEEA
jgi:hypothetical protein